MHRHAQQHVTVRVTDHLPPYFNPFNRVGIRKCHRNTGNPILRSINPSADDRHIRIFNLPKVQRPLTTGLMRQRVKNWLENTFLTYLIW